MHTHKVNSMKSNYTSAQEFQYFAVNFTVTSVGVRQLCLRRIGVHSQKSLKTAGIDVTMKSNLFLGVLGQTSPRVWLCSVNPEVSQITSAVPTSKQVYRLYTHSTLCTRNGIRWQWRSDWGAGRTRRHLLGTAKGRKTPNFFFKFMWKFRL